MQLSSTKQTCTHVYVDSFVIYCFEKYALKIYSKNNCVTPKQRRKSRRAFTNYAF